MSITIVNPSLIPINVGLTGTEFNLIYNPTTGLVERVLVSNSEYFILISNTVFRLVKSYTGSIQNTGVSIEINDKIQEGVIRNNSINIEIIDAVYNGGSTTDFGTYDGLTSKFTGGSYTFNEYREI